MSLKSFLKTLALMTAYFSLIGGIALLAIANMDGTGFKYAKDHYPFFATLNYDKAAMITPGLYALFGAIIIIIVLMLTETEGSDNNVISNKLNTPFFYILLAIVTTTFALTITLFIHIGSISLAYKADHPYTNKPVYTQADKWDDVFKEISEQECECLAVDETTIVNLGGYMVNHAKNFGKFTANGYCTFYCGGYYIFLAGYIQKLGASFSQGYTQTVKDRYKTELLTNNDLRDSLMKTMSGVLYGGYGPFVIVSLINAINLLLSSLLSCGLIVLLKLSQSKAQIGIQIPAEKEPL